jgi:hypothetical protein
MYVWKRILHRRCRGLISMLWGHVQCAPAVPACRCCADPAALLDRFATASSSLVTSPAGAEALRAADTHGRFVVYPATQAQGAGSAGAQPDEASRAPAEAPPEAIEPRAMHRGRGFHSRTASLFGEDLTIADIAAPPPPPDSMPATSAAATRRQPENVLGQAAAEVAATTAVASELPATRPGSTRSSSFSFPDLPGSLGGQQGAPGANGPEPDAQATLQLAGSEDDQQLASSGSGGSPGSGKHSRRKSRSRIELPPWQS